MSSRRKRWRNRIVTALAIFVVLLVLEGSGALRAEFGVPGDLYAAFALFLIPYAIAGYDVLVKAALNIAHGEAFDESFLMSVATLGAFGMVFFPGSDPHMAEGAAVMLFYQIGELFQSYALGKSRSSIAELMDIAPDFATIERDGALIQVDPSEVPVGSEIVIKPGERIPIDGIVREGSSQLDTAALTGESIPRRVMAGSEIISGCVNLTGALRAETTKPFATSTVSRILELVENASEKKARTENFITRFARVYTPLVTAAAVLLAGVPPLVGLGPWSDWILRGLTFLVVSCPCALVISVPLSFFGGIGGASRLGILIKGSNYLELLAHVDTVVFDKTGTLTSGTFNVVAIHPEHDVDPDFVLSMAAHAEALSDHPIAVSLKRAFSGPIDQKRIREVSEEAGHGVSAKVDEHVVLVGNDRLMESRGGSWHACDLTGTILHVCVDGSYAGHIVIADMIKDDAQQTIRDLHDLGVHRCVMLTGDRADVAEAVGSRLGIDETRAQLLPEDKVDEIERLLMQEDASARLAFVGDGINDAPVLARADVGIAMGAMGSDAAIEAADVVLMDDRLSKITRSIEVARKTMRIVRQNIAFAIGVKILILGAAAAIGVPMWLAVFGDVGVAVIAILNAMRSMRLS